MPQVYAITQEINGQTVYWAGYQRRNCRTWSVNGGDAVKFERWYDAEKKRNLFCGGTEYASHCYNPYQVVPL